MQKFPVDPKDKNSAVTSALEYIHERLKHLKLKSKDETQSALMAEESLLRLIKYADFSKVSAIFVKVFKSFGNVKIILTVPGEKFNFAETLGGETSFSELGMPETQEAIQNILMRSFEDRLSYSNKHGLNTIRISAVKSTLHRVYITLAAIFAAVVIGILMKSFAPESFNIAVNKIFLERFKIMYMNALKTAVTPLVFFSIISCLSQFGSFSELGKLGGMIITFFLIMTFLSSTVGAGVFLLLRPGAGVKVLTDAAPGLSVSAIQSDFITDIVPSNILLPFLNMNMIQVVFLALTLGASMGTIGSSAKPLQDFFEACNKMFMAFTKFLIAMIPAAAFCSLLSAALTADTGLLLSLARFCVATIVGLIIVFLLDMLYVALVGRLNPLTFVKGYLPVLLFSFSSSTSGCIPLNMKYCEKLGIPSRIYSFSVPLGTTVSLDGVAMFVALTSLTLAEIYGINLSLAGTVGVIVSSAVLAVSAPGIPSSSLICIAVLIAQLGVPPEALSMIIGVDVVLNLCRTPVNVLSAISTALVVSSRMGVLDTEVFNSNA